MTTEFLEISASVDYCAGRAEYGSSELAEDWRTTEMLLLKLSESRAAFAEAVHEIRRLEAVLRMIAEPGCEASRFAAEEPPVADRCLDPEYIDGRPGERCTPCSARAVLKGVRCHGEYHVSPPMPHKGCILR
jgi:hypothetical protein